MRFPDLRKEYSLNALRGEYFIVICGLILLLLCGSITVFFDVPFNVMSRDPLAVIDTELLPHIGMLSNIGAILWSVGAGISFFSFVVFFDNNEVTNRYFLLYSCLFTLLLLTDDLFMLHDIILPQFFQIKEDYLYLLYLILMGIYLFRFRSLHLKSKYILLILAITCFAFSIFVDQQFQGRWHPARHFVEDGFKFMGIAFWTSYLFNISRVYALGQKEI